MNEMLFCDDSTAKVISARILLLISKIGSKRGYRSRVTSRFAEPHQLVGFIINSRHVCPLSETPTSYKQNPNVYSMYTNQSNNKTGGWWFLVMLLRIGKMPPALGERSNQATTHVAFEFKINPSLSLSLPVMLDEAIHLVSSSASRRHSN